MNSGRLPDLAALINEKPSADMPAARKRCQTAAEATVSMAVANILGSQRWCVLVMMQPQHRRIRRNASR